MLLSIAGGSDLGLFEINEAAALVSEAAHAEANIIFGAVIDDALGDEVRVTVIAAGFDGGRAQAPRRGPGPRAGPAQTQKPQTQAARPAASRPGRLARAAQGARAVPRRAAEPVTVGCPASARRQPAGRGRHRSARAPGSAGFDDDDSTSPTS